MDSCIECGKDIHEECPYCEECLDEIYRRSQLEIANHEARINEWASDVQAKHDEWHRLMDLANDDRKIKTLDALKEVMAQARQVYREYQELLDAAI